MLAFGSGEDFPPNKSHTPWLHHTLPCGEAQLCVLDSDAQVLFDASDSYKSFLSNGGDVVECEISNGIKIV